MSLAVHCYPNLERRLIFNLGTDAVEEIALGIFVRTFIVDRTGLRVSLLGTKEAVFSHTPLPIVFFLNGGGWMVHNVRCKNLNPLLPLILLGDCLIAVPEYRLSYQAPFPAALLDLRLAYDYALHCLPDVKIDIKKVAIWGHSSGGHLAALLAFQPEQRQVKTLVLWGAPTDLGIITAQRLTQVFSYLLARYFLRCNLQSSDAAEANPILLLNQYQKCRERLPYTLIVHGIYDKAVTIVHALHLQEAIKEIDSSLVRFIPCKCRHNIPRFEKGKYLFYSIRLARRSLGLVSIPNLNKIIAASHPFFP